MSSVASDGANEAADATADAASAGGQRATRIAASVALACAPLFARLVSSCKSIAISSKLDYFATDSEEVGLLPHDAPTPKKQDADFATARASVAVRGLLLSARLLESCLRWSSAALMQSDGRDFAIDFTQRMMASSSGSSVSEDGTIAAAAAAYTKCVNFGLECVGDKAVEILA